MNARKLRIHSIGQKVVISINFDAIRTQIFRDLSIHSSFDPSDVLAGFEARYLYLSNYGGLKPLLCKFTQKNPIVGENLFDIITEFNLAYEILKKAPLLNIEYEPEVPGNRKRPDFKIQGDRLLLYIQVKRMRKCNDYEEQLKETPDSDLFYLVDPELQIHKALAKAAEFQPPEEGALYMIAQEINFKANTRDTTHSQAIYGREKLNLFSGRYAGRDQSGFFRGLSGQRLCAYITLRKSSNLHVFASYESALFISPYFEAQKERFSGLLDFDAVYYENDLPQL